MAEELDALTVFTQSLVQTKSMTGSEQEVAKVISREMARLGFDHVFTDEFGNLIGMIDGKTAGQTILLDGHTDTVEANPLDWTYDPWKGVIQQGRLYGRGAADMKGSLAAMIYAAGNLNREQLRGRVVVSASVSEEHVEGGALKSVIELVKPDYVVIGESTELNLARGGRGRAEIQVTTLGQSAHSSSPQAGRCAVTDMIRVIQAVSRQKLPSDKVLGPSSIVLTDIISEPYPGHSVIPYRCSVTFDQRLLTHDTRTSVLDAIRNLPGLDDIQFEVQLSTQEDVTCTGKTLTGEKFFPAWLFEETHPFVQAANTGLIRAGFSPDIRAYRFCTNAAYSAGVLGIPTVGFGIGREEDAHIVDESISIEELHKAVPGFEAIIQSVCS